MLHAAHALCPADELERPAGHALHAAADALEYCPIGHRPHCAPPAEYVPAVHAVHTLAPLAVVVVPSPQIVHAIAPVDGPYWPIGQPTHAGDDASAAYSPIAQGTHATYPEPLV